MQRITLTWPRRVVRVVIAGALVWALLLAVERQGGAQAQPRATSHVHRVALPGSDTQAAVVDAASAQKAASAAVALAEQATPQALPDSGLPPAALDRVCAALLIARANLVAAGAPDGKGLLVIDGLITRFGCKNISNVPASSR